jgi:hypothetical protein
MVQDALMEEFIAEIRFRFRAESIVAGGSHLHRLSVLAQTIGFEMESGKVLPAPPEADRHDGTGYAPMAPHD